MDETEQPAGQTPQLESTGKRYRWGVILAYIYCGLVWGSSWFAVRLCIGKDAYPTHLAAGVRFLAAAVIFAIVWLLLGFRRNRPTGRELCWIVLGGIINGMANGMMYASEEKISGGLACVLGATSPLIVAFLAAKTGTEEIGRETIVGLLIALFGVSLVFHDRLQISPGQAIGVIYMLGAATGFAAANVTLKRQTSRLPASVSACIYLLAGGVINMATTLVFKGVDQFDVHASQIATAALLYLTIFGSVGAFGCYLYLLKHVRLMTATTLVFVQPVLALVVDMLWERDVMLGAQSLAGIGVVLLGVALSIWNRGRR